jgi:hypothetical protein
MILVILGISLIVLIVGVILFNITEWFETGEWFVVIGSITLFVSLAVTLYLRISLSNSMIIDDKIELYQTENTKIENQIATIVENYKDFEKDAFKELKNESAISLVSLYPELKSDKLVEKQINTYTKNNNKIKELKEEKLDYKVMKWWLYFGG